MMCSAMMPGWPHGRRRIPWLVVFLLGAWAATVTADTAEPARTRFFLSGDGHLNLASSKNGTTFDGRYRIAADRYDPEALRIVHQVFDAPYSPDKPRLSLRLLEYLDYLQDQLRPGSRITITSGYRSPAYNRNVRQGGGLAAKASMHQYGMAADFIMEGVPSRRVWEKVKALGFGGTGYYQGQTVHVDVGPARFWDETDSGVGTGISDDNQLIGLVADYDIYSPDTPMYLHFIRMTAFPIGVTATFELRRRSSAGEVLESMAFRADFNQSHQEDCPHLENIEQMAFIRWRLPHDLPPGRYDIQARFCDSLWERMPRQVATPVFVVSAP
jgi:uncharacterized protein YcbK (DUF882 family)